MVNKNLKKLIIIQTIIPDYRTNFYNHLYQKLGNRFELYSGETDFEKSIKMYQDIPFHKINNHFFLKRKFLLQTGILHLLFSDDVLVLGLNPRILNHWIFLIIRKLFRKKTVLWGHAWPRKGQDSFSDHIRHTMRLLADEIIVYTQKQQKELQKKMPKKKVYAAPNALYFKKDMTVDDKTNPNHLIYVGRFTKEKKVFFLVQAFHHAFKNIPENIKLLLVGDGEEQATIQKYIVDNNLTDRIQLLGHISDYNKLKQLYNTSFFSVSPGYIGLSVTQSFGFGVPIIVSKNENHSPEIEAVLEHTNALFFETDNMNNFAEVLQKAYHNKKEWINKRPEISLFCKENYSVETMAQVFINLVNK